MKSINDKPGRRRFAVIGRSGFIGSLFAAAIGSAFAQGPALAPTQAPVLAAPHPEAAPPPVTADEALVPPLKDRGPAAEQQPTIVVRGFKVTGVGDHDELGITPASMQKIADQLYAGLAADFGSDPVKLSFVTMQMVADRITERYKAAGFILSRAFLPAQSIDDDKIVRIDVLEGRLDKVIVKGNKRYDADVIAAPAEPLKGKPLLKSEVETALLYATDLPGVNVSSTFQPGEKTGDTDLVLLATEDKRPLEFSIGGNNFGTDLTGLYRVQAGVQWNSPLGLGDTFNGLFEYGIEPTNNIFGLAIYRLPIAPVRGLGAIVGYSRNQVEIGGDFAAARISGPSANYYGGAEWRFVNTPDLKATGNLRIVYETSRLTSVAGLISDDRYVVANSTLVVNRTDKRYKGVDVVELGLRKSIDDQSIGTGNVEANDSNFVVGTLTYTRLQFLTKSQRLLFRINGQYTQDALAPIERFTVGGPESVRAYPVADVVRDRGVFGSLEYHVSAPGFGDVISPFYGRPWREILEFELFGDIARSEAAGQHRLDTGNTDTRSGAGAGFIFRLPRFYQMQMHFSGAVPISNGKTVGDGDNDDFHIYGQIGFSF